MENEKNVDQATYKDTRRISGLNKNKQIELKPNSIVRKESGRKLIKIGTWNVQGTNVVGKLKQLAGVLKTYKMDIVAVQELKQKDVQNIEVGEYIVMGSGCNKKVFGVGFMFHKSLKNAVIKFEAFTNRVCYIRIKGKFRNISMINVHAPTEDKDLEEKVEFYEQLEEYFGRLPKYDVKVLLGDCNAKIGREEIHEPIIGRHSLHRSTNQNGEKLIEFAMEQRLKIMGTCYEHKDIHKATWKSPNGITLNQIDHFLIENQYALDISDVRVYRGADIDSDHYLLVVKFKESINRVQKLANKITKYDLKLLTQEQVREDYQSRINENLRQETSKENINEMWTNIEKAILSGAQKLERNTGKKGRNGWFDEECQKLLEERKEWRLKMIKNPTNENKEKYAEAKRVLKKVCRKKKKDLLEAQLVEMEQDFKKKDTRKFYKEITKVKRGYQARQLFIEDEHGNVIGDEENIKNRWKNYFSQVFKVEEQVKEDRKISKNVVEGDVEVPEEREIKLIIKKLKNNKSPGENKICAEMIKYGGEFLQQKIVELVKEVWRKEVMPDRWHEAVIHPLLKKGDSKKCENYRGIALLDVVYKIVAILIKDKLQQYMENKIGDYQAGFRKGSSIVDHVHTLRLIQETAKEHRMRLYVIFIDFAKAYDTVRREKIYKILEKNGIPGKIINLVKMTLQNTRYKVRVGDSCSADFVVERGLRQGDPLSTVLFNFVLDEVIKESRMQVNRIVYMKSYQCLAYADDVIILAQTEKELIDSIRRLRKEAEVVGLKINESKTEFMEIGTLCKRKKDKIVVEKMEDLEKLEIKRVEQFKYLGSVFTEVGGNEEEIKTKLKKGTMCAGKVNKILRSKNVTQKPKLRVYKTVIRPTVISTCETWTLTKNMEILLEIWERKILRRIFGGVKENGIWRRRTNAEVYELYGEPKITQIIKVQRMKWLGHIIRMPNEKIVKQALDNRGLDNRGRGRPRLKWIRQVEEDIAKLGITGWREITMDRKAWREVANQALGHIGL